MISTTLTNINEVIIQDLPAGVLIHFLDSDDYLRLDCIQKSVQKMRQASAEVVLHSFDEYLEDQDRLRDSPELDFCADARNSITDGMSGAQFLSQNKILEFYFAWQGIFQARLLNPYKLRFTQGIYHEDHDFGTILLLSAKRLAYVRERLLVYVIRSNSIISSENIRQIPAPLPYYLEPLRRHYSDYSELRAYFKSYCLCRIGINIQRFYQESLCAGQDWCKEDLKNFIKSTFKRYTQPYVRDFSRCDHLNLYKEAFAFSYRQKLLIKLKSKLRFNFKTFKKKLKEKICG